MRWNTPKPHLGDTREIFSFLWLPRCINGEWRWLEGNWIKQQAMGTSLMGEPCHGPFRWVNVAWSS